MNINQVIGMSHGTQEPMESGSYHDIIIVMNHHDIIFCPHQDGGFIKIIGKKKKDPTLPLIYTFFWFDFSKAIRNDIVLHILIRNVMKFGEKQLTMLAQTQYSVLSATLRVCVCVWMMSDFRILHMSFYPVN